LQVKAFKSVDIIRGHSTARHVHSHDMRTLADLPWSGYRVTWRLRVRTLCCRHAICPRRIFTERLPGMVAPWARRTVRLMAHLLAVALYDFPINAVH
jgi:transposase